MTHPFHEGRGRLILPNEPVCPFCEGRPRRVVDDGLRVLVCGWCEGTGDAAVAYRNYFAAQSSPATAYDPLSDPT